ncbi:TPA: DUF2591 family protein [Morganella morganii subsp. morganii]|nr:DUF2591 family protein [Morganella morganii subsp. morganii]
MNKYRDKSDFEINKAAAKKSGKQFATNGKIIFVEADVPSGIVPYAVIFDPCNNPADAMPIINGYGISLIYQEGEFQFATNDGNIECSISNPLKAAMVIFLMMKDAENEKI